MGGFTLVLVPSFWIYEMKSALSSTIPASLTDLGNSKHLGAVLIELEFESLCMIAGFAGFQDIWDGRRLVRLWGNDVYSGLKQIVDDMLMSPHLTLLT